MIQSAIRLLLIEDNPSDERLIKELLRKAHDVKFDISPSVVWQAHSSGLKNRRQILCCSISHCRIMPDCKHLTAFEVSFPQYR